MVYGPAGLLTLLRHRGLNPRWLTNWLVAWGVALLAARVGIPAVSEQAGPEDLSLHQLGAIGLCLPLALIAVLLRDQTPWLTESSPHNPRATQGAAAVVASIIGLLSASLAGTLSPGQVGWSRFFALFALLLACTVATGVIFGSVWSAIPACALVLICSIRGAVPWEINVIYNPATDDLLLAGAAITQVVAVAASFLWPARQIGRVHAGE